MLILDGLGDLPSPALRGQTPLEAARTPVLDGLAGSGLYGLVDPVKPGKIPNTHSGCGTLMGVLPTDLSRLNRGPIEASGAGRKLGIDEIALRANFATLQQRPDGLEIVDRRAGRISSGTDELAAGLSRVDLGDGISAELLPTDQHRCVVVLSGPGLNPEISDSDPGDRGMPAYFQPCVSRIDEAGFTAEKVNLFLEIARTHLAGHPVNRALEAAGRLPANAILMRGAGWGFSLDNVLDMRGVSAAVVAGCNTVIGLARTLGSEVKTDSRFTADANTDLAAKMRTALATLEQYDLVYVHIKAPDLFAHDHQPDLKRAFLEKVDEALKKLEQAGVIITVVADHSTDSNSGAHTADPVPALLFDPSSKAAQNDSPVNFSESACSVGNMPRQSSHQLLLRLLDLMEVPAVR